MRPGERPFSELPGSLLLGFMLVFGIQILVHQLATSNISFTYKPLTKPFKASVYQGLSLGSEQLMSYLLAMRLQIHDNQAGRHIRYDQIDYVLLIDWLKQISQLNQHSEYPMILASRVYSQTQDKQRLRILLEFIDEQFTAQPQRHWRRQAEATVIARHQLGDLELALRMAEKISIQPQDVVMPPWARDMHFLLLGELNEFESAIVIIQALLKSNAIADKDEVRFLGEKLLYFQQKLSESRQNNEIN